MKLRTNKVLLCFIIFIFVILNMLSLSIISVADTGSYNIEVFDEQYEFLKTHEHVSANYYDIIITLKNNGVVDSDAMTLEIWEKEEDRALLSVNKTGVIINAGEIKEFKFEEWVVTGTGEHTVMYEYHPTNKSKINNYNSGSGSFKINDDPIPEENTPGFELVLFLLVSLSICIVKKRMRR